MVELNNRLAAAMAGERAEIQRILREIAELKMKDLNANDIEAAERMIAGTARSMGITIDK